MVYYNIHTHHQPEANEVVSIFNRLILPAESDGPGSGRQKAAAGAGGPGPSVSEPMFPEPPAGSSRVFFSVGIHPWYIDTEDIERQWVTLQVGVRAPGVVAVGEAGLDKLALAPLALQLEIFRRQALLAEECAKPLIVHCVKAWGELMGLRKKMAPRMPWVVHGFRGNRSLARQLTGGGFYLSVGDRFRDEVLVPEVLPYLFMETDDRQVSIRKVYAKAADALEISEPELADRIRENVRRVFLIG